MSPGELQGDVAVCERSCKDSFLSDKFNLPLCSWLSGNRAFGWPTVWESRSQDGVRKVAAIEEAGSGVSELSISSTCYVIHLDCTLFMYSHMHYNVLCIYYIMGIMEYDTGQFVHIFELTFSI